MSEWWFCLSLEMTPSHIDMKTVIVGVLPMASSSWLLDQMTFEEGISSSLRATWTATTELSADKKIHSKIRRQHIPISYVTKIWTPIVVVTTIVDHFTSSSIVKPTQAKSGLKNATSLVAHPGSKGFNIRGFSKWSSRMWLGCLWIVMINALRLGRSLQKVLLLVGVNHLVS